jgi:hypothetical protein
VSVIFLKREEATSLLREIIAVCDGMNEQAVMLMPPNADDVLSHGYQLHIKPLPDNLVCLRPLIEKRDLKIAQEPTKNLLVIYRPMNRQESLPTAQATPKQ